MKAILRAAVIGAILAAAIIPLVAQWPVEQGYREVVYDVQPDGSRGFYYEWVWNGVLRTAAIEAAVAVAALILFLHRRLRKS